MIKINLKVEPVSVAFHQKAKAWIGEARCSHNALVLANEPGDDDDDDEFGPFNIDNNDDDF